MNLCTRFSFHKDYISLPLVGTFPRTHLVPNLCISLKLREQRILRCFCEDVGELTREECCHPLLCGVCVIVLCTVVRSLAEWIHPLSAGWASCISSLSVDTVHLSSKLPLLSLLGLAIYNGLRVGFAAVC